MRRERDREVTRITGETQHEKEIEGPEKRQTDHCGNFMHGEKEASVAVVVEWKMTGCKQTPPSTCVSDLLSPPVASTDQSVLLLPATCYLLRPPGDLSQQPDDRKGREREEEGENVFSADADV